MPIIKALGAQAFGLDSSDDLVLWFGVLYLVNMQMSFLSPPFGYALFYLKSVAPPEITMGIIFRAAVPFLFLQAVGLALVPPTGLPLPLFSYGRTNLIVTLVGLGILVSVARACGEGAERSEPGCGSWPETCR